MTMRFDTSLLSSLHPSVSPSRHFKSPANSTKSPPTQFKSRGKITVRSSSSATTPSQNPDNNSLATFYGRRGLISTAALLPFLLEMSEGFGVNLQGVDASESSTIQSEIRKVLSKAKAPGVLRLVFHDAGTFDMDENLGGMNGSIVYELDRPENAGLSKSVKILEKAKGEVDKIQPVSWADMIAVAGAEAVSVCGGPIIPIQLGRLDSMVPDPKDKLPLESLDASGLKKSFLKKGFRTQELVALSGAHTLGGKGFGNPTVFDSSYFKVLLEKPWTSSAGMSNMIGLPSDHALVEDDECLRWIRIYADDQAKFFKDFKSAYIKLVNTGAVWRKI
ncbi:putative L-ascorbate peroxidase 6 isoform X2 [Magnolia sinica]|uniref:putative L-ascorbate peroxidase 6 isoform X2 n=1 Tax=Magnolia sinica TaxID=86752 RepID=UPI00265806AA|nr:putative L-ascorbate peroxidase 6 isoform X2 [Magnolia sinica]